MYSLVSFKATNLSPFLGVWVHQLSVCIILPAVLSFVVFSHIIDLQFLLKIFFFLFIGS